jgi:hypothetical protein
MLIGVVSPVHGQAGNTTVAMITAMLLAETQKKKVLLVHASSFSSVFYLYFGMDKVQDATSTPQQLSTQIRERQISHSDVRNYCRSLLSDDVVLDVFANHDPTVTTTQMQYIQDFIFQNREYDFIVVDVDIPISGSQYATMRDKFGAMVVNITQSVNVSRRFEEVRSNILSSRLEFEDKIVYCCNQFYPSVGSRSSVAKMYKIPPSAIACIRPDEGIMRTCNEGKLENLLKDSRARKDARLISDMKGLISRISKTCGFKFMWKS